LERRNIHIAIGPQGYLLELVRTDATMRPIDDAIQEDWDLVEQGHYQCRRHIKHRNDRVSTYARCLSTRG
jgi:hypothetical protein